MTCNDVGHCEEQSVVAIIIVKQELFTELNAKIVQLKCLIYSDFLSFSTNPPFL